MTGTGSPAVDGYVVGGSTSTGSVHGGDRPKMDGGGRAVTWRPFTQPPPTFRTGTVVARTLVRGSLHGYAGRIGSAIAALHGTITTVIVALLAVSDTL